MKTYISKIQSNTNLVASFMMVAGSIGVNGINYFYHMTMGRMLGVEMYGTLASIYSLLYIVTIIPQSSSVSIVKFMTEAINNNVGRLVYNYLFRLSVKSGLFVFLLMALISPFIARFLNTESTINVFMVAPVFYLSYVTIINQASLQSLSSFEGVVITNFLSSAIKFVLGVLFILLGLKVFGAMLAVFLGVLVAYYVSARLIANKIPTEHSKAINKLDIKNVIRYSVPVLFQSFAFILMFSVDVLFVKHFFSSRDAGVYAAAATIGKIIFFAVSPLTSVMFTSVSNSKLKKLNTYKAYIPYLIAGFALSAIFIVVVSIFPVFVVKSLYGSKFIDSARIILPMVVFVGTYTLSQQLVNYFLAIDKTKIVIIPMLAAALQIILILFFHKSLLTIVSISLGVSTALFVALFAYFCFSYKFKRL